MEKAQALATRHPELLFAPDKKGLPPSSHAMMMNAEKVLRFLIDHGVDILFVTECVDADGVTVSSMRPELIPDPTMSARIIKYALWRRRLPFKMFAAILKQRDTTHIIFRCDDIIKLILALL